MSFVLALLGPLALLRAFVPAGEGHALVETLATVWGIAIAIGAGAAVWRVWKRVRKRADVPPR
jgi:hypothetical protein